MLARRFIFGATLTAVVFTALTAGAAGIRPGGSYGGGNPGYYPGYFSGNYGGGGFPGYYSTYPGSTYPYSPGRFPGGYYPGYFSYPNGPYAPGYSVAPAVGAASSVEPVIPGTGREGAPAEGVGPATVAVHVPAGAEVWVNGDATKQRGEEREFTSPPLPPDKTYYYEIRSRWTDGGSTTDQTRSVAVRAHKRTDVDFTKPEPAAPPK